MKFRINATIIVLKMGKISRGEATYAFTSTNIIYLSSLIELLQMLVWTQLFKFWFSPDVISSEWHVVFASVLSTPLSCDIVYCWIPAMQLLVKYMSLLCINTCTMIIKQHAWNGNQRIYFIIACPVIAQVKTIRLDHFLATSVMASWLYNLCFTFML